MEKVKNSRKFRKARIWSNKMLRQYAGNFEGSICNVSGWKDEDKEGGKYKDYFINASNYYVTNYGGYRGVGNEDDIHLDLEANLPTELQRKFNVVFNHTTLEHIFNVNKAVENLCEMAEDILILVVPFLQEVHITDSYGDFWRFSPYAMERMLENNGFSLQVCDYNNDFNTAVYLFCIAVRTEHLEKYKEQLKAKNNYQFPAGEWLGYDWNLKRIFQNIFK